MPIVIQIKSIVLQIRISTKNVRKQNSSLYRESLLVHKSMSPLCSGYISQSVSEGSKYTVTITISVLAIGTLIPGASCSKAGQLSPGLTQNSKSNVSIDSVFINFSRLAQKSFPDQLPFSFVVF